MNKPALTDAELHAYVDGELLAIQRAEVEVRLATDPTTAERVRAYRAQKQALRELFAPVLDEPIPESLREAMTPPQVDGKPLPRWSLQRIAASVFIAIFSGVLGWMLHDRYQPTELVASSAPLARQAAIAHAVFSPDVRRPVEISAEYEDQHVTWLSKRLGTPVRPPKLGALGYELIGGRLLAGNSGPVAQFMYHDISGQRLTLYVSPEIASNRDTAFRFAQEGPINVFYWIDGPYGYALSSGLPKDELARIASAVYDQLDHR